jgi:hypothetical protein
MIATIVRLLIAFPKLGRLFLSIRDEYTEELNNRRLTRHRLLINKWVHDSPAKPDTRNDPEA